MLHAAVTVLVASVALVAPGGRIASADDGPMARIGTVRMPFQSGEYSGGDIVGVDAARRRMYYLWLSSSLRLHASEFGLEGNVPRLLRDHDIGPSGVIAYDSYNTTIDPVRRRAYQVQSGSVTVIDLATLSLAATWPLAERVPGFAAIGAAHSAADRKVYLLGIAGDADVEDLAASTNRTVAIVALDDTTGALAWYRPLRECAEAMKLPKGGAWLARSAQRRSLYVFCTQTAAILYQGQSALVRLDLPANPATAATADVATADVATFPIGGAYKNAAFAGVAALDPVTDRVFIQSQSTTTPGAFVFDGLLSAWVGQIPAPTTNDYGFPTSRGVDAGGGRYYMATIGKGGCTTCATYLVSTYGRALPVQAGSVQFFAGSVTGLMATDPVSRRLFVPFRPNGAKVPTILVFRDTAPPEPPNDPEDYDDGTTGAPPTPSSFVFSDAASNAYGASYVAVGGTGGIIPASDNGGLPLPFSPARGTRGLMTSRLSGADLSSGGAASAGSAVTGDSNTEAEYESQTATPWRYPKLSCLDGGGAPAEPAAEGDGGTVRLRCDLARQTATGSATYGRTTAGPYSTTATEATTTISRTGKDGAMTLTTASARGVGIGLVGVASVAIGSIESTATSKATGVRGNASAAWTRRISGFVVKGPTGLVLYESPGCTSEMSSSMPRATDDCQAMIDEANRILPDRIRLELPAPEVVTTPKGAFAAVGQTDADYYQSRTVDDQGVTFSSDSVAQRAVAALRVIVYNDSTERSRVVSQYAAVQAGSILQVFAENPYDPGDPLPTDLPVPTPLPTGGFAPQPPGGGNATPTPQPTPNPSAPIALPPGQIGVEGLSGLLRRPLGEAALLGLLLGLYGTAALTAWRRRRLVRTLEATS